MGIVGLGAVGSAVLHGMSRYYPCVGYDLQGDHDWSSITASSMVLICTPTPLGLDRRLDCTSIESVLTRLSESAFTGPVVVKSTVRIGFMEGAAASHPQLRLVYMPEFLRERSRYSWFLNPDRLLLAGRQDDVREVLDYFSWAKGAAIFRTSFRDAEVAKLAHNAFIATKVSFTNEVEVIARETGADPSMVMSVVAADRRVLSDAHLRPGLGRYGGKCVPKDTEELARANGPPSRFMAAVLDGKATPDTLPLPERGPKVVVILPTRNRSEKLFRALTSIATQVHLPDLVLVVSDSEGPEEARNSSTIQTFADRLSIRLLSNTHTRNLSGAVNTGLDSVHHFGFAPSSTFVALLDDDDWWEPRYLDNALTFAEEMDADWVVTGLVRHEQGRRGLQLPIPTSLVTGDFLTGNPNVQGSNLFVRLARIDQAGEFDETLPSTTDRDICIRLLRVPGIRYEVLRNYLVHHDASDDPSRLSARGSPQKRAGLLAFYAKYVSEMSEEQRQQFRERARILFAVEIPAEI